MKLLLTISFVTLCFLNTYGQAPSKEVNIVTKDSKELNFSEIKIESEAENSFKTLELRYKALNPGQESITIDGVTYKCFVDKKSAIKYYYLVKKTSPTQVIYYVHSVEAKKPEIFTFRILE